ncbi:hypothetical protein P8452_76116 [Trifolium repens]|nr:hypothetical protein P8452_76116 [Trifolium repens]
MQRIPSTSIATVRPPTGGDEQHVGPTYTLGTASPRVCTGPGVSATRSDRGRGRGSILTKRSSSSSKAPSPAHMRKGQGEAIDFSTPYSNHSHTLRDPVHPLKRIGSLVSVGGHLTPSSIYNVTLGSGLF